jgi:ATP-dependent DNA helicase RecG
MLTLDTPVSSLIRLRDHTTLGLKKLGIHTVRDLLYHFPSRYADSSIFASIGALKEGEEATVRARITKLKASKGWKSKVTMTEGVVEDMSGNMRVVWFNQPYLSNMLHVGDVIELTGKVTLYHDKPTMTNPSMREEKAMPIDSHDSLFGTDQETGGALIPVYPETKGISSEWFHHTIMRALANLETIPDHIPESLLKQYSLPVLKSAFIYIHTPKSKDDATKARKRFAFDEILTINLARQKERAEIKNKQAYYIDTSTVDLEWFRNKFPFALTGAQQSAVERILLDLEQDIPMSRLLEGDVGSGKTAVAALATYATVMNRPSKNGTKQTFGSLQVAYMAPTEILATQHFESFIELFKNTGISIALITGSGARKFPTKVASSRTPWTTISKPQLKKWIANGEIPIVIGTHALIQKSLEFKHLALAIIDEQHRFGLAQRKGLAKKDAHFPHLLSMTATPIPRTLALTIYGDLDLSVLDQMPAGRKWPKTEIVPITKRDEVYTFLKEHLALGRQLYVICPRIDAPDEGKEKAIQARSVMDEAKRLAKDVFPKHRIGTLHSKMTPAQKDAVMLSFKAHEIDILVATSVVEVGVNVPNATLMIIEGAERFGLSQLHQLRGRIMRSSDQPYCYLFTESKSEKTAERLQSFVKATSGFELAEYDLHMRGTGELTGLKQSGISDIGMEALRNPKLVEVARESARAIIEEDPELMQYPLLLERIQTFNKLHLE